MLYSWLLIQPAKFAAIQPPLLIISPAAGSWSGWGLQTRMLISTFIRYARLVTPRRQTLKMVVDGRVGGIENYRASENGHVWYLFFRKSPIVENPEHKMYHQNRI